MHSNLKTAFIMFSLFLSPVAFAQMEANPAPAPQPQPTQVQSAATATQTAATRATTPNPTQVGTPIDTTTAANINTGAVEPTTDTTFLQKIWAPVKNLFYRATDALGITSNRATATRDIYKNTGTRNENPGRHSRVYMRQSGSAGSRSETDTKTDAGVIRQTTDTSSSVNLLR